ncbi:MAG: hypothetical protein RR439_01675 [Carnobacterium sp.]
MKKISLLFILAIILTGCSLINPDKNNKKSSTIESTSQIDSEISVSPNEVVDQKEAEVEKEPLVFVPQLDEINQGLTTENDKALSEIWGIVEENQDMGFENDVTIVYSGETFGKSPNLAGIFLIVNRTNEPLENLQFTYTFGGVDKQLIFDQKSFKLTAERFGVLEPNTVMPMYFVVKAENENDLKQIDVKHVIEKVEEFKYDIASKGNSNSSTEENTSADTKLTFKIPKQNSDKGQTIENNPLMSEFKAIVDKTKNFLVINKTNVSMKDIHFDFNYGDSQGNMVWEKEPYHMSSEVFGVLGPMTVLPVTLTVPEGKEDLFLSITEDNVKTSVEEFKYNQAN